MQNIGEACLAANRSQSCDCQAAERVSTTARSRSWSSASFDALGDAAIELGQLRLRQVLSGGRLRLQLLDFGRG